MVRLKDIAARAGVSVMTVSKVLRDAPDISGATKARVRQLAQQMGYVPDSAAQGLRTRTTRLLGLVLPSMANPIYPRITMAIEEQAQTCGYDIILTHSQNDPEREETIIKRLLARRVDGLFVAPAHRLSPQSEVYSELLRRRLPIVVLGPRSAFCAAFTNIESEDLKAATVVTRHLLDLGHKHIAFFAGPSAAPDSHERIEGYRRALREAGLEQNDHLLFHAGDTIEDGQKAALQMVNEMAGATAVLAYNDMVAIGAAQVFQSQGWSIPKQISIAGFGNTLLGEHCGVPLTTIRQPKFRLGLGAMELMQKLLRGERPPPRRIEAELIIRASTTQAPR
jgi:LacI family transcriptional regulator